jgi:PAS domain S-box-containing protein
MSGSRVQIDKYIRRIRVLLAFFIPLAIFISLYLFLILPSLQTDIYDEKKIQTSEMVQVGISVLEHFHSLEIQGLLTRGEAQKEASELIRSFSYGERGLDYFWISDFGYNMIVHPFRTDLEGKLISDSGEPEDIYLHGLFQQFISICMESGAGHLSYAWQYYDETDRFEEKLSYVASFEPWSWIIGTGVYLTDLETVIAQRRNAAAVLMALFFIISAGLAFFYYRSRSAKLELLESEEKYRLIADNTADVIIIMNLDLRKVYVSPAIVKMKGFTPEEAVSMNMEQTLTAGSLKKMLDFFCRQSALEEKGRGEPGRSFYLMLEEYCKDGSTIWVENAISFIRDSEGKAIGILALSRDITWRIRQQEALLKEQREKTVVLENLAELVSYVDKEMRAIWANPAIDKTYNKTADQYLGRKCYDAWHGLSEPCASCPVPEALKSGKVCHSVTTDSDGRSWSKTGSPVFEESGEIIGVIATSLEITELKRAEAELRQLNEGLEQRIHTRTGELEQANKELAAFTYSVSHDLRAPLRSIVGFSEAILEDYSHRLDDQGIDFLERICLAGKRMNELIDDLLKLSRVTRQELHCDCVDLSSMAEAALNYLKERDSHRNAELTVAPGLFASGDAALLRIALDNLIDNAWKYTAAINTARIEFGAESGNGKITYFIRDNGVGFDMAHAEKIFQAFQRLHSVHDYPGTGIGLSIVQRIIERHGGTIWSSASPGKGSTFCFTLPEAPGPDGAVSEENLL